jgi:hypothetical protein
MNPAIERLCKTLFPHGLDDDDIGDDARCITGFDAANGWEEEITRDDAALTDGASDRGAYAMDWASALTEEPGDWDVNHYREFSLTGGTKIMLEGIGQRSRVTAVSEDLSLHEARVEFVLNDEYRGSLTLLAANGICIGHRDLAIAWADLDLKSPRFDLILPMRPG